MATALDPSYIWGLHPDKNGITDYSGLNREQLSGLGALMPGMGPSSPQPAPDRLNPYAGLPQTQFSSKTPQAFDWVLPQAGRDASYNATISGNTELKTPLPTPNLSPDKQPYFDPNYPVESLAAERNFLAPQVSKGAFDSLNPRGLQFSGLGGYAKDKALGYLNESSPVTDPQQALAADLSRLYGPAFVNSLAKGANPEFPSGGGPKTSLLPGIQPSGDGTDVGALGLVNNPNQAPGNPGFGFYNYTTGQPYASPGYWYNPNQPPDASQMPWLNNAIQPDQGTHLIRPTTSPTSQTSP